MIGFLHVIVQGSLIWYYSFYRHKYFEEWMSQKSKFAVFAVEALYDILGWFS